MFYFIGVDWNFIGQEAYPNSHTINRFNTDAIEGKNITHYLLNNNTIYHNNINFITDSTANLK